jgi:hypothetical protein
MTDVMQQLRRTALDFAVKHDIISEGYASLCEEWVSTGKDYHRDHMGGRWIIPHPMLPDLVRLLLSAVVTYESRSHEEHRKEVARLREVLEFSEIEVSAERSWCRLCRTESLATPVRRNRHPHSAKCVLYTNEGCE